MTSTRHTRSNPTKKIGVGRKYGLTTPLSIDLNESTCVRASVMEDTTGACAVPTLCRAVRKQRLHFQWLPLANCVHRGRCFSAGSTGTVTELYDSAERQTSANRSLGAVGISGLLPGTALLWPSICCCSGRFNADEEAATSDCPCP